MDIFLFVSPLVAWYTGSIFILLDKVSNLISAAVITSQHIPNLPITVTPVPTAN